MAETTGRTLNGRIWAISFAASLAFGLLATFQRRASYRGPNPLPDFWDHRFIQPQLIPWLVWAAVAPLLLDALHRADLRADLRSERLRTRLLVHGALALLALTAHATVSGVALGFWWAFPSPIPIDPVWHIQDLLRNRSAMGLLVCALITAIYYAGTLRASKTSRASAASPSLEALEAADVADMADVADAGAMSAPLTHAAAAPTPRVPALDVVAPHTSTAPSPIALKTGERVVFVWPQQIDWVEADGDYVIVHSGNGTHRVRDTISAMEGRLPSDQLIRVSRSAIVNLGAIREMQPWFRGNFVILLRSGAKITTGARYRDRLLRRM